MSPIIITLAFLEFFLCQILAGIVPKATVLTLPIEALIGGALLFSQRVTPARWWIRSAPIVWVLALAWVAAASALWSDDWGKSLASGALLCGFLAATVIVARSGEIAPAPLLRACVAGQAAGTIALVVVVAFELMSDQWISRHVFTWFPALRETPGRHVFITDGVVTAVSEASSNRRVLIAAIMMWPLARVLWLTPSGAGRAALIVVAACAYATMLVSTKHQSSQLAIATSGLVFLGMLLRRSLTLKALAVAWASAVLLVVPAVHLLAHAHLQAAPWLFESARQRVVIWQSTASGIEQRPLLGVGAGAMTDIWSRRAENRLPTATGAAPVHAHAHNAFLQTWYELGALGALVLLGAGLSCLRLIGRLTPSLQPAAAAQFATIATMIAFSFGFWQGWLLAALCSSVAALWLTEILWRRQSLALHDRDPERG